MKVERHDGSQQRLVMTGMIVDTHALAAIVPKWEGQGLFDARWCNIVGKWCVEYYRKYKKAPGRNIEGLYGRWADNAKDKDAVKLVESFLSSLSGSYARLKKQSQTDYIIDSATALFTKIRIQQRMEEVQARLEEGKIDMAEQLWGESPRVDMSGTAGVDVIGNFKAMKKALEHKAEPLIVYKGALGKFFGDSLERDGFISFEGPEKRGKTWILMDLAWNAMQQGRRVAFFEVGDLSEAQAMRRFAVRAAKMPMSKEPYQYPIQIEPSLGSKTTTAQLNEIKPTELLTWSQIKRACKRLVEKRRGGPLLKLWTYPMSSISIAGIEGVLTQEERNGYAPDVIVVDYADILAPVDGRAESRDQVNTTWKGMRRISQLYHNLFLTATQTDADSYDTDIIDMANFSEDKRKRAHVTGSVGINQTDEEKEMGIFRFNWIVRREWSFSKKKCVHVAGCLALARPCIHSTF